MVATRLRVRTAGAVLAAGALLTAGCAGDGDPLRPAAATDETPAPSSSAAPTSAPSSAPSATPAPELSTAPTPAPSPTPSPAPAPPPEAAGPGDLRDRLLPASAFGDDATVVALSLEQLGAAGAGWGGWGGGWPGPWYGGDDDRRGDRGGDVTVEPAECRAAVDALPLFDGDAVTLVAQAARTPQTQTVEVLAESPDVAALQLPVDQLAAGCSTVTATGPWGWTTTVEVRPLEVPQLGQQSGGVQFTVDAAGEESVNVLVGYVVDGSRGLLLAQSAAPDGAAPDPAAFTALLSEAAEAAAG
jgi:hypothetical protein